MKLRLARKVVSSNHYWRLYYKDGKPVVLPTSGHHWDLFQRACVRLGRPEVIGEYCDDLSKALE